ncbi:MAG: mechanosensitive ion channel family protein, partial [Thermaurantiacus sp.]
MEIEGWWDRTVPLIVAGALKVAAAIVLYMVGRWLISFAIRMMQRALTARNFDPTLQRYIGNILAVVLNVVLVIAILGYFGLETTSFAALLAGVGLA